MRPGRLEVPCCISPQRDEATQHTSPFLGGSPRQKQRGPCQSVLGLRLRRQVGVWHLRTCWLASSDFLALQTRPESNQHRRAVTYKELWHGLPALARLYTPSDAPIYFLACPELSLGPGLAHQQWMMICQTNDPASCQTWVEGAGSKLSAKPPGLLKRTGSVHPRPPKARSLPQSAGALCSRGGGLKGLRLRTCILGFARELANLVNFHLLEPPGKKVQLS